MNSIKIIFLIAFQNIRKWKTNYRIWMIAIVMLILVNSYVNNIAQINSILGEKSTVFIYPFIYSQFYMKLIFTLPIIMIFCDAPFIDNNQLFVILRSKRMKSTWGQIMYIVLGSGIYYLFILTSTIILSLPYSQLNMQWGKVLHTLAETNTASSLGFYFIEVNPLTLDYFTPLQAIWFTFLLSWLCGICLGLIIYFLNLITHTKSIGVIISSALVILSCFIANGGDRKLLKYSLVSWNTLNCIDIGGKTNYPSFYYCMVVYISIIILMTATILIFGKHQPVLNENQE